MCEEQVLLNQFLPEIQLCFPTPARSQSSAAPPPPAHVWRGCETLSLIMSEPAKALQKEKKKNSGSCPRGLELEFFAKIHYYFAGKGAPSQPQENCSHGAYHYFCGRRCSRWPADWHQVSSCTLFEYKICSWKGQRWCPSSGFSTGITRSCSLPHWSPVGATPVASSGSNIRSICLTWCQQTFSY